MSNIKIFLILLIIIMALGAVALGIHGRNLTGYLVSEKAAILEQQNFWEVCQTSACIEVRDGQPAWITLFGGLVNCGTSGFPDGRYSATYCTFRNGCSYRYCGDVVGPAKQICYTSSDCTGGACVNARYVNGELVIDGGQCSTKRAIGDPGIIFTCVCTPQ